jgi:very-short-patch-repair endonuclease
MSNKTGVLAEFPPYEGGIKGGCPEYKLALEIIGDVHGFSKPRSSDLMRTKTIEEFGIKILSFTNLQIQEEMDGVLGNILSNLPHTPSFIRRGRRDPSKNN